MNTSRIKALADKIEKRQLALHWLEKFRGHVGSEAMIKISPYCGSGVDGYNEACSLMEAMTLSNLPAVIDKSIAHCENDIMTARAEIIGELG